MKRVISVLRDARHGGTVIFVPIGERRRTIPRAPLHRPQISVRGRPGPTQLSRPHSGHPQPPRPALRYRRSEQKPAAVGWREFETTTDDEIETLDEALFETAHLIAGLAAADGAVVMSKQNELLGFGGMISGRLPDVERVGRALDLEGEKVAEEETGNVGARHRSAYRLASALPGSVAVVISQDGGVRWVCQRGGRVTYWEQE